jgi:hypothetical protein
MSQTGAAAKRAGTSGARSSARAKITTPQAAVETESPFVVSELHHQLLATIGPYEDIGRGVLVRRDTVEGLSAFMSAETPFDSVVTVGGETYKDEYPPVVIDALLADLGDHVKVAADGKVKVTAAGRKALGGVIYAEHQELRGQPGIRYFDNE